VFASPKLLITALLTSNQHGGRVGPASGDDRGHHYGKHKLTGHFMAYCHSDYKVAHKRKYKMAARATKWRLFRMAF